ncbi:MAG: CPBP family intramembrane metalloprotease [Microlunatus sp.]|nr:CPBP family intramembrane metalloprotease [Microlunatus sp.]
MIIGSPLERRFGQFIALCFGLSWLPWAALGLLKIDIGHGAGQLVFGLAASGPSLAALVLWLGKRRERIHGSGRTTWFGLVAGLGFGAAAPVGCALILNAGGLSAIGANLSSVVADVGGPLVVIVYTLVSGPLSEEFGWRGYLQPRLRQRFGPLRTALLLGPLWAVWHLPLFLLPGTGQHRTGLLTIGGLVFFVSIVTLSYIMIFVTERLRGGVWAAVAAHAGFNAADALMPGHGTAGDVLELSIMIALAGAVAVLWRLRPASDQLRMPATR